MGKEWNVFAGDEFSVNLQVKASKVWAKVGSKPIFPTHTKSEKVNVIGALNNKTGKVLTSLCQTIDKYAFLKFLKKLLRYYKKVFLVIDNASWHHAKIIRQFVKENKHHLKIEFFPAYSPEYNPSEQCWKSVKKNLITTRLFLSLDGLADQIKEYFRKTFFNLRLERFLGS